MVKARERDEVELEELIPEEAPIDRSGPVIPAVKLSAEEPIGDTPDSVELYLNEIARYKLLRPDEEVSLAKSIENGRIIDEAGDAWMEEHLSAPTIEQTSVRLLRDLHDALGIVRRSRVLKGFPQRGSYVDQLEFPALREAIQDRDLVS